MPEASALAMPAGGPAERLLSIYDRALPQVYGYVVRRCGVAALAEDITADVFMAAAAALTAQSVDDVGIGWLIGTARHKLIDHWRRDERHRKALTLIVGDDVTPDPTDEPISTTHTLVGAILGVGLARGIGALNLGMIGKIFLSWIITLPAGAILSIIFFFILRSLFGGV